GQVPTFFFVSLILTMLTLGQASCLVLGYKPTEENRKIAKQKLQDSGFIAIYIRDQDSF
ncbi:hypothetical protein BDF14DRAFT_1858996, partial [Spinellus fusiger]